jgi:hypothetical protein
MYFRTCQQYSSVYKIHTRSVENQIVLPWYSLSLYPRLFKWWRKSPSLCLVVSIVEHIRFILMVWLNGRLLKQCLYIYISGLWSLAPGSLCSHLTSLFRENFRHRPSSLERNWKKWSAGQVVSWTTRCSVMVGHFLLRTAAHRRDSQGGKPH